MGDSVPETLHKLLESVKEMGIKVNLLLLDREFFSVDTIKFLQKRKGVPYMMLCT